MGLVQSSYASATVYQNYMGRWSEALGQLFLSRLALTPDQTILDVGCGTGSLTKQLVQQVDHVMALDPDSVLLSMAEEDLGGEAVSFLLRRGEQSGLPNGSVDGAVALLSLHNVPNPIEAVQEMQRVVKPGGLLAACEWDFHQGMEMFRAPWEALLAIKPNAAVDDTKHMPLGRAGELERLWRNAGVGYVQVGALTVPMNFANYADFLGPTMASGNALSKHIKGLNQAQREHFESLLLRRFGVTSVHEPINMQSKAHYVVGQNLK